MRVTTKKSVLAGATGALALSLLLSGCTGGGSDSEPAGGADETSGSSAGGSTTEASAEATPERTGDLTLPGDCEEVAARLGGLTEGLEPSSTNSITDSEATCLWSTPEGDPSGVHRVAFFLGLGEAGELGLDRVSQSLPGASVEELDDERAAAFDGTTYAATMQQEGLTGVLSVVSTPAGGVGVADVNTAGTLPQEELVDLAFEFVD